MSEIDGLQVFCMSVSYALSCGRPAEHPSVILVSSMTDFAVMYLGSIFMCFIYVENGCVYCCMLHVFGFVVYVRVCLCRLSFVYFWV